MADMTSVMDGMDVTGKMDRMDVVDVVDEVEFDCKLSIYNQQHAQKQPQEATW